MTILYPTPSAVKPARTFGKGLLRSLPVYRADHSASDAAWLASDNARREAEGRHMDRLAGEADAVHMMEAGCYSA